MSEQCERQRSSSTNSLDNVETDEEVGNVLVRRLPRQATGTDNSVVVDEFLLAAKNC